MAPMSQMQTLRSLQEVDIRSSAAKVGFPHKTKRGEPTRIATPRPAEHHSETAMTVRYRHDLRRAAECYVAGARPSMRRNAGSKPIRLPTAPAPTL